MTPTLDELIAELEDLATKLRAGELDAAAAAGLVERCADVVVVLGRLADREDPGDGQEQLL